MTRLTFAIRQTTEIDGMLEVNHCRHGLRARRIGEHSVTDIAVVANHLSRVAHMLAGASRLNLAISVVNRGSFAWSNTSNETVAGRM